VRGGSKIDNSVHKAVVEDTKRKSKSFNPPFLLTFEIFDQSIHNCIVESRASSNVMLYSVCKKLNATPTKCSMHIIQLDRYKVKEIDNLNDVFIRVASNSKVHKVIDIVVVNILEAYNLLLSQIGHKS